jgi:predicted secreted hydrolase
MKKIQYTESPGIPPRSMDEEFLCHRNGSEWWYATGILYDEDQKLYTFQYTLARVRLKGIQIHILMTALTDFSTEKHYYAQKPVFFGKDVIITPERVALDGVAEMTFSANELGLNQSSEGYSLSLKMEPVKPRVWHCEDGILTNGHR